MNRVSCIDIGTNTALLLIADLEPASGAILPVFHRQTIVRLGERVDERKLIGGEAMERLAACMREYRRISEEYGAGTIIAGGTSALRDASNREGVIAAISTETGIDITCISGNEEAELTFFGAVAGMNSLPETFMVIDIGGGSTEISIGSPDDLEESVSMDIGSVRLTERFFSACPPSTDAFEAAREEINRVLTANIIPFFEAREAVYGVAGTLTTLAQVSQRLKQFDALKVQNYPLTFAEVDRMLEKFRSCSLEEIVALGIPKGRADVITMGALILRQFMRLLGVAELRVSIQGLRFGLAQKELLRLQQP
ncbi:MAG: Ppx/GppA family phosphatase [Chlorobiaceae bacterium]|jgi:exopolyphosphatase/guanosine-5'-triphosphate,3'-diphosphate pyrophosphatase|nr:Ppx/GppA family phosphatase [Chlorobiaceae bacterium]